MKNIKEAKKKFIEFLKKKKLKITYERKKILEEVFKTGAHFDAEGLYLDFKRDKINISRATIYRTLDLLVESGLITKIRFSDNTNRYEQVLGHEHHSHIICKKCGKIEEFTDKRLDNITKEIAKDFGYSSPEHNFRIYGICRECLNKNTTSSNQE